MTYHCPPSSPDASPLDATWQSGPCSGPTGDTPAPAAPEARYRAIFEQSGQGIALMDKDFVLTQVNPAFCRLLGYTENELLGRDSRSLISPGDLERQPFLLGQALSGSPVSMNRLLQAKDGSPVPVEVSVRRISDNEVVMVFWDKTESVAHQNALARERQRLRTLLDTIPGPVWALRRDMSLAATNAYYDGMAGNDKCCFCKHAGVSDPQPCLLCPTRKVFDTRLPAMRECSLPDGRVFLISAVPFQGEDGEPLSLGLAVDITTQKELESELQAARSAAESADKAKSAFLASVSHEIRTPLNSVLGHLQLLAETRLNPAQAESARMALGSGRLLMRLIDDILDLSRIESGKISVVVEDFNLRDILAVADSVLGPAAQAKGLALTCAGEDVVLRSDPARIAQIVINLAGNAVKYTDTGYVRVALDRQHAPSGRSSLAIVVEDSGPGIPGEKQELIFRSYTQLHPSARSTFGGVGLGLAIVKRLVEAMGGSLTLDSLPGRGTAVRVLLPAEEPGEAVPNAPGDTARPMEFLVVEDEKVNQVVIVKALESRGHAATVASNGLEALELLRKRDFDAVIMDIMMPFMDGLEATRAIREGRAGDKARNIPVAALSAHDMETERDRCIQAGMNAHLSKPLELAELDRLLSRLAAMLPVA